MSTRIHTDSMEFEFVPECVWYWSVQETFYQLNLFILTMSCSLDSFYECHSLHYANSFKATITTNKQNPTKRKIRLRNKRKSV